jgi:Uma2 family endonuclease
MAVESTQQIQQAPVRRWRFTVDDFMLMGEAGIFPDDARVELIEGEVIEMNPIGPGHSGRVMRLNAMFHRVLGGQALLSVQNPFQFRPRSQPQPDVMLLRPREDYYTTSHPTAADTLLLIEVSDSSLDYDRKTKAAVYAQAGIAEYWIVNLVDMQLMVYRRPVDGEYRDIQILGKGDSIQPLAFRDVTIDVAEILA